MVDDDPARSAGAVTRRAALGGLGGLGAMAFGLALAGHAPGAAAQEASPAAKAPFTFGHPLVGVWRWTNNIGGLQESLTYGFCAADGTYIEGGEVGFVAVGVWRATGERTAELVLNPGYAIDLHAVLAPPYELARACLVQRDTEFYRIAIELDAAGNAFDATGVTEFPDGNGGMVVGSDVTRFRAERMTVTSDGRATPTA